jgi:tetratricopeptide (TPR) repeat protein
MEVPHVTYPKPAEIKTASESIRLYKQLLKTKKPRREIFPYLFRALKLEPNHPEANFLKGKAILDYYHYVRWPEALNCFDITITSGWKQRLVWALTLKGSLLVHLDRLQDAQSVLKQAVKTGAKQLFYLTDIFGNELYVRLIKEIIRAGMVAKLLPAGKTGNIKGSALKSWAGHYIDDEKAKKAIARIEEKSNAFLALERKGEAAVKKGNLKEAIKHYEVAIGIANDWTVYLDGIHVYNSQFQAFRELKEYQKASLIASRMTERFYFHIQTWRNKGLIDLHLTQYKEGVESFDRAIELGDDNLVTWNGKAAGLLELKRYSEAMKCVTHVLEKDPENTYAKQVYSALKEIHK